jgi:signal transduction histidine kinase
LQNLLSNAVKFTKNHKVVRIEIEANRQMVQCRIVNWGVGIPANELDTVFDKFVQSSKTQSGAGGTGLGLAICKEILRCHHGRIWADSRSDSKTTFTFELLKNFQSVKAA